MSAPTQYRQPAADYRAEAARSPWRPLGGWRLRDSGDWSRVYSRGLRTRARRAVAYLDGGWWQWRVEEFDLRGGRVRRVANRNLRGTGFWSAPAAFPWADAAARTSD